MKRWGLKEAEDAGILVQKGIQAVKMPVITMLQEVVKRAADLFISDQVQRKC